MKLLRTPAFLAAVAITVILAVYFVVVASLAVAFLRSDAVIGKALGVALVVLPLVGAWWLLAEWRLSMTVQRMGSELEREGRLPVHDGERDAQGKLTEESVEALFEVARRGTEERPDDWVAWFHVGFAYDEAKDRSQARKALRHAADLYRADKRAATDLGN